MITPNVVSFIEDKLTPDGQKEKLVFRKFDGIGLSNAAETSGSIKSSDVEEVVLKVNPKEMSVSKNKIVTKIATNSPGRWVILEWGNDLDVHTINGSTGNLLPSVMTNGMDPTKGVVGDYINQLKPGGFSRLGSFQKGMSEVDARISKITSGALRYSDILNMSPKYKTFKRLEKLYKNFDADSDVLIIEVGDSILRSYFAEFSFTVTAESPWNWNYSLSFVELDDLSSVIRKDDDEQPRNSPQVDMDK